MYDIIGDIHGQADRLDSLFKKLRYEKKNGVYQHPERSALFLGDLIDRGQQNRDVIKLVRPMVEEGVSKAILGNHEYNAICFHSQHPETGQPLRRHDDMNKKQHATFLHEFPVGHPDTFDVIQWFQSLPLFLDTSEFRAVHACWDCSAPQGWSTGNVSPAVST
ncbi:metallophosphoesterase [Candidatus Kaiserbacteria bacterium]|nr:metallophosphoesterase [Candidatus Kaiserbacteria bacterium]